MIPRNIFAFWSGKPNVIVEACFAKMREMHPGWNITILDNFEDADDTEGFDDLSLVSKTDWLRICLLERHGGVWLDASTVCVQPVTSWVDLTSAKLQGFSTPFNTGDNDVLENWALAAPARHGLVQRWKAEFQKAIAMGFLAYKEHHASTVGRHVIQNHMPYLTMHGAYVVVHDAKQVCMIPSGDETRGPYAYICPYWGNDKLGNIGRHYAVSRLFLHNLELPPLLKLVGRDRKIAGIYYRYFPTLPHSFAVTRMGLAPRVGVVVIVAGVILCIAMVFGGIRAYRSRVHPAAS